MENKEKEKSKIYSDYQKKVYAYIYSKVSNSFLAEDLCNDVFVKVFKKYDAYDSEKASVSTWIYTIAHNTVIDYYRCKKETNDLPEDYENIIASEESIEGSILHQETLSELADALETLSDNQKEVIILRYYSGLKLKEIAEKMGLSYSYVKLLHNNALAELRNILDS